MTTGMGCEGKSWIWGYARGLGKSVSQCGPKDFQVSWNGEALTLSGTIRTAQEAEAIREIIRMLGLNSLPATRPMVRGDLYWTPPPAARKLQRESHARVRPLRTG